MVQNNKQILIQFQVASENNAGQEHDGTNEADNHGARETSARARWRDAQAERNALHEFQQRHANKQRNEYSWGKHTYQQQ